MENKLYFGTKIVVSDPCYTIDTWCNEIVSNMKEGNYIPTIEEHDGYIRSISIVHEDHQDNGNKWGFVSDNIGVDSGQCGFFNIDSYRNDSLDIPFSDAEGKDFYESYRKTEDGDHWYGKICGYTLRNEQYGELQGVGLVSSSGFGDGSYNLYAKRDSSRKGIALKVKFF